MLSARDKLEHFEQGRELFNTGSYFAAHEAWEKIWREAEDGTEKQFLQGLIMAAGSFLHYTRRECAGAVALLGKSTPMIRNSMDAYPDLRLFELAQALEDLRSEFSRCSFTLSAESLPKIGWMKNSC